MSDEQQTQIAESQDTTSQTTQQDSSSQDQQQQTEQKDTSLLNENEKKAEAVVADVVPDKYEFTLPEGFELNEATAEKASTLFKELGLPQGKADKLVGFYAEQIQEAMEAPFKFWKDMKLEWRNEIKNDPAIGGKLPEVKETIARAIDGLGDPKLASEFREAMDLTGAGDNPKFIRLFYALAQKFVEGGHVAGGKPSPHGQKPTGEAKPSAAHAMYPNLP